MALGVGLAGYGLAGRYLHAPLIAAAGMKLTAVATSQADAVRGQFPQAAVAPDMAALLARSDVELVVIATPNALHAEQGRAALEAGRHVVIDKPAAPTAEEIRSLQALADARGRKLAVYHNRRWDADFLTLQAVLRDGAVGRPMRLVNRWRRHRARPRPERWREQAGPGAGLFYDLGPHLIDQALTLFGPPDWVQADIFNQRGPDGAPDDGFELWMGKGALRIALGASSFAAGPARLLRLDGDRASFVKQGFDPQEPQLRAGADPLGEDFGAEPESDWGALIPPDGEPEAVPSRPGRWLSFYTQMRAAIEDGGPVPVPAEAAAQAVGLIELAFESARTGRRLFVA